ncbi:PREDICTED: venom protease-like [Nicrophorus vespilloides]|uniref:Venom protease-like n=1 Tax=Nicrophorus vespilloides TaxID=110193 RepID=A0ABM1N8W1_NICVS|nr:PREDICTED: venom protease-like [Nicrophorus vespilloides]
MVLRCLLILSSLTIICKSLEVGDACKLSNGKNGDCKLVTNCPSAIELINRRQTPILCGFEGFTSIVCCDETRIFTNSRDSPGKKSKDYCEYINPATISAVGGVDSLVKEFPHMAALGVINGDEVKWLCGGSLINERFIITAAHCLISRDFGILTHVRLGDLNLKLDTDDAQPQDYGIKRAIKYPEYNRKTSYHDLALLELDRNVNFTGYVKPACLNVDKNPTNGQVLTATGWGRTQYGGDTSDHLQKIEIFESKNSDCSLKYKDDAKLNLGIVDDWQICASAPGKDTCQVMTGDSGGPLQKNNFFYHTIYGVTSFGKACGLVNVPGVYTRISYYIDWIEKMVWPNGIHDGLA